LLSVTSYGNGTICDFDFTKVETHSLVTLQTEFASGSAKEIEDAYVTAKAIPAKKRSARDAIIVSVGKDLLKMRRDQDMGDTSIKVLTSERHFLWTDFVGVDALSCQTRDE
jgi:hypothetical protein